MCIAFISKFICTFIYALTELCVTTKIQFFHFSFAFAFVHVFVSFTLERLFFSRVIFMGQRQFVCHSGCVRNFVVTELQPQSIWCECVSGFECLLVILISSKSVQIQFETSAFEEVFIVRMVNVDAFDGYGWKVSLSFTENAVQNTFADSWMCWANCGIMCTETLESIYPLTLSNVCVRECCVKATPYDDIRSMTDDCEAEKPDGKFTHRTTAKIARALHTLA